jgi:excisionase family DNA binding protein
MERGRNERRSQNTMESKFLSVSEAARILNMSADWVRLQEKSGKLRAIKSGAGIRLFALEDIQKLAAERQTVVGKAKV